MEPAGTRGGEAIRGESHGGAAALLEWLIYPAVTGGALALCAAALARGAAVQAAAFGAAGLGVAAIVALERALPYRREWRGSAAELLTDSAYLAAVQLALPLALGLALAAALAQHAGPAPLWPHRWPLAVQFALLLAAADLGKYALHRASHRFERLWRLHAVHHAPEQLYAMTVNRFHPLERTLQYALETAPFALLGVDPAVPALYLVFHSVHGFFQHANVRMRLGWANYVLSGPELHRWHHSRITAESNANYANHLSLWDVLLGSFQWPQDREVGALGLHSRSYPRGLLAQLRAPFAPGIDKKPVRLPSWGELGFAALLRLRMARLRLGEWRRLAAAARDPRAAQEALLRAILAENRATRFGREHGFAQIRTAQEYRSRVPVQSYESLRPYLDAQLAGAPAQLCAERPELWALTSGTTAAPKHIPYGPRALARQRRDQGLAAYLQYRAVPGAYAGPLLALAGPAAEGALADGAPFGSISGYLYRAMPRLARSRYVLPPEVFEVPQSELRALLAARLALAVPDVSALAAANPSSWLALLDCIRAQRGALLEDLAAQRFARSAELAPAVRRAIAGRFGCAPARLAELRERLARPAPSFAELWPGIALLVSWTGGSCGSALERLRRELPPGARVMELGYLASELRGSFALAPETRAALPALRSSYLEFVEKERWERGEPQFLGIEALEPGAEYHVFCTTRSGLYRYFMNDIVRAGERVGATPLIEFVQKGKGVTSITGEKLYEGQWLDALRQLAAERGEAYRFALLLADVEAARYRLLLEADGELAARDALAPRLDALLGERNLEYRAKRASLRLAPLELCLLRPGTAEVYKASRVAQGQRESQWKWIALQYAAQFDFDYAPHALRSGEGSGASEGAP